jgi:CheY-like chemotaxis protein
MRKYLEHYNYSVATALSATEGLRYLQSHLPQVIFLDQLMPGITGLEMLRTLKTDPRTFTIPVVMCTSVERPDFKVEARDFGAVEVHNKPPNLDLLDELLSSIDKPDLDLTIPPKLDSTENLPKVADPVIAVMMPEQVHQYAVLREEINQGLVHLTDEIFVQISELRAQVRQIEDGQLTGTDRDAFRQIAKEEADSLYRSVQAEMNLIRRKLDAMDALHRRDRAELQRDGVSSTEVRTVAEQAVADAVNRFSRSLTEAIVKALGKQ